MDLLRGERGSRPPANASAAPELRARLESAVLDLLGPAPLEEPIIVSAASLREFDATCEPSLATPSQVRGVLINQALRLASVGVDVDDAFTEAMEAWRAEVGQNELTDYLDRLDADACARLAADVAAHWDTLKRSLGALSPWWLPRSAFRAYQRLAEGRVVLRDVVDLMVGTTASDVASVALLDVTTSPLGEGAERIMRYHALIQTLRSSIVPLRTSMFSTATGELWCREVDDELLARSVEDVVGVVARARANR